jgi:iron complex transport system substrate-binding protein
MRSQAPNPRSARVRRLAAALFATALVVAACSSDDDSSGTVGSSGTEAPTDPASTVAPSATDAGPVSAPAAGSVPAASGDPAAFPVTFDTMFGETVVEELPRRVVSVGYTEGDLILALGVTPVAIRDWYGDQPGGLWPWAADAPAALAGDIEVLPAAEINFEQVAALDPDIIFGIGSGMVQEDFDKLSEIAPVVAQSDDYNVFGTPWDVAQLMIGQALGLEAEAQALVDDIEAQYAAAVEANPAWQEMTGTVSAITIDGTIGVFTDGDNRGHMLTQLGFSIPEEITAIAGDSFYADISTEQISLLDNDLVVYMVSPASDREAVEALPLFQSMTAVQEGRTVFVDDALAGAMGFASTLSIPYALEALVPQIQSALGE